MTPSTVFLTGATGFVGAYLYPALEAAGLAVRCATRNPQRARARQPDRDWIYFDANRPETLQPALAGCDVAYYLIHGMHQGGNYPERERENAAAFARAAEGQVKRIVYLGGVVPSERPSKHLASRQVTGTILRSGSVPALELRAAMVIGVGSASWTMVRDLAKRLPAMVLPRWLKNTSFPIAVDDVVYALLAAARLPEPRSQCLEIPGAERVTHREMLERTAILLGRHRFMVNVPVLTPRLSSYWIALVTRVGLDLARELVEGVRFNLEPQGETLWQRTGHAPMSVDRAVRLALEDEGDKSFPSAAARQRLRRLGRAFAAEGAS